MSEITREQIEELCKRLEIKADMIQLGETIAYGSDSEIMREAATLIRRLVAERDEAIAQSKRNWDDCGKMHDALGRALQIVCLSEELCDAVDAEAEDIETGKRKSFRILQEIGPLVEKVQKQAEEAFNGWPRF